MADIGRSTQVRESLTHAASIHIPAPPSVVYAAISDVTRTGEWSPVCGNMRISP